MKNPGHTILVVDDDQRNIFALSAVLKSRGFTCLPAHNAMECIDILNKSTAVNIVLLDMMMPGIDGYHAIRLIKNVKGYQQPAVIAVTAQAMPGDREKCIEAGADDYISKPVDVDLLLQKLNLYLNTE